MQGDRRLANALCPFHPQGFKAREKPTTGGGEKTGPFGPANEARSDEGAEPEDKVANPYRCALSRSIIGRSL